MASQEIQRWVDEQRAVARALGLSLHDWVLALERAGERRTELMAAVIGAASARRMGLGIVSRVDGPALAGRARELIDPDPPRVENPVLAEAIRRRDELTPGKGKTQLRRSSVKAPRRGEAPIGPSVGEATSDAPGGESPSSGRPQGDLKS